MADGTCHHRQFMGLIAPSPRVFIRAKLAENSTELVGDLFDFGTATQSGNHECDGSVSTATPGVN